MEKNLKIKKEFHMNATAKCVASVIVAVLFALFLSYIQNDGTFIMKSVIQKGVIYAVIAVSMNLLNGFTGLFSLGQAGFMLLGALTFSIFSIPVELRAKVYSYVDGVHPSIANIEFAWPICLVLAGLVAAIFAFLIGFPVLRLKSDYLAIATLGFAEIIRALAVSKIFEKITNGSYPLNNYPTFNNIYLPVLIAAICILLIALLIRSTYGRAFKAIRDDEIAAEAMGINLSKHKQLSFIISSFFAGVGGGLLAMFQTTVSSKSFMVAMTYEILLIVVIGGIGSISGSIFASFLYIACSEWWLRFLDTPSSTIPLVGNGFRMVVFSIVIMIIVLFWRRGIMGTNEITWSQITKWINKLRGVNSQKGGDTNAE